MPPPSAYFYSAIFIVADKKALYSRWEASGFLRGVLMSKSSGMLPGAGWLLVADSRNNFQPGLPNNPEEQRRH